jgi:hypothetical protein
MSSASQDLPESDGHTFLCQDIQNGQGLNKVNKAGFPANERYAMLN